MNIFEQYPSLVNYFNKEREMLTNNFTFTFKISEDGKFLEVVRGLKFGVIFIDYDPSKEWSFEVAKLATYNDKDFNYIFDLFKKTCFNRYMTWDKLNKV